MFKESFKYYKTKKEEISLEKVYDFNEKGVNFDVKF